MSRNIIAAVIGHTAPFLGTRDPAQVTDKMIRFWQDEFKPVMLDNPDIVLVPECCDRPSDFYEEKSDLPDYYRYRGDRILNFFREIASSNKTYLVYSAVREISDGSFRNSQTVIGRDGEIAGVYDKVHPIVTERTRGGILCGTMDPLIRCDFGTVGCAVCFDLNFDDLRLHYKSLGPDLVLFSSMYHGGLMQGYWAYSCRSFFAGAIAGPKVPSEIRNPFGEVISSSTNYHQYTASSINLDRCMTHLDNNREKLAAMKEKYRKQVSIHDPGKVGSVMIQSWSEERTAPEMVKEFGITLLDDYFSDCIEYHSIPENRGNQVPWDL
ncbi:MAG: carbon-nitrogen hydrolase family protein [Spirochaetia bacterium]